MGGDVSGSKEAKNEPNVVPLCDILLVLLIIFMVVTPLIKGGVHVKLPNAANTQTEPEPGQMTTVHIKADGVIYLDDEEITDLSILTRKIEEKLEEKKQTEKAKVLLRADEELQFEKITVVMDEIRRANIEVVGLITDEKIVTE